MEEICKRRAKENLEELMLNISLNIKQNRKRLGFTQNDVAYYIGSDKSVISSIETGAKTNISLSTLTKIASLLDTTVIALLS
jgi:transcriptional regulator with XRE-family HTH domain